jgi:uncharacterized membrane protein (UPF0127 family)
MRPMKRTLVRLALIAGAAAPFPGSAQQPQPQLPTIQLNAGLHLVQAEVANTFQTRMTGLMHRPELRANSGMLFVFPDLAPHCMWMKNTLVPLSVAFIDERGVILNIADMQPLDETSHCAKGPARFALEMNQGWFAAKGIKAGAKISGIEKAPPPR